MRNEVYQKPMDSKCVLRLKGGGKYNCYCCILKKKFLMTIILMEIYWSCFISVYISGCNKTVLIRYTFKVIISWRHKVYNLIFLHYIQHFVKGNGPTEQFPDPVLADGSVPRPTRPLLKRTNSSTDNHPVSKKRLLRYNPPVSHVNINSGVKIIFYFCDAGQTYIF